MPYWFGLVSISKTILVMVKSIVRILTRVCLDLLSLVNSLHTLIKILTLRVWQYCLLWSEATQNECCVSYIASIIDYLG